MLPANFRKLKPSQRIECIKNSFKFNESEIDCLKNNRDLSNLADLLIESSIGTYALPFGIATGFVIDNKPRLIPIVTEEASVIVAASHAASIIKRGKGFLTWADEPIMTGQIYLRNCTQKNEFIIQSKEGFCKKKSKCFNSKNGRKRRRLSGA